MSKSGVVLGTRADEVYEEYKQKRSALAAELASMDRALRLLQERKCRKSQHSPTSSS